MRPSAPWTTPGGMWTSEPFFTGSRVAVEEDRAFAFEDVIEFRGDLVVVQAGSVDVDGVGPGGDVGVLPADEQVPPAARAPLARSRFFVTDE